MSATKFLNETDNTKYIKEATLLALKFTEGIAQCELNNIPLVIKFDPVIGWIIKVRGEVKQYPTGDFEMVVKETIERIHNMPDIPMGSEVGTTNDPATHQSGGR